MLRHWAAIKYPGYKVLPPGNIAIDRKTRTPFIYRYKMEDLYTLQFGGSVGGRTIRGWQQDLSEITWHIERNNWVSCKEMEETGYITVNLF